MKVAVPRWHEIKPEYLWRYYGALEHAGLEPVDIEDASQGLAGATGLMLTGGADIDPSLYGEPIAGSEDVNRPRDELELAVLRQALEADVPVLAICRGFQLLNVCLGGSLLQHIDSGEHRWQDDEKNTSRRHDALVLPDTRLSEILGARRVRVNSRHHQAVTPQRLAPGLRVAATTDDGLVEAAESEGHTWVLGVQWHPEREEDDMSAFNVDSARLFRAFGRMLAGH